MNPNIAPLTNYIQHQLQTGLQADEVRQQLLTAGHAPADVDSAFELARQQLIPTPVNTNESASATQSPAAVRPVANGQKRGRIKTGWILFKQSMSVLNGNRYLLRYLFMTYAWILGFNIAFVALAFGSIFLLGDSSNGTLANVTYYVFVALGYVTSFFIVNFYAAALAAHVLDIFKGQNKGYAAYIGVAKSKAGTILTFSIIQSIVGIFLQYVVERIRFIGWILSYLLGTAWSLATMFVLPIIIDNNETAPSAIKHSMSFFKQTWGENITAKVTINLPLGLINLALLIPVAFGFIVALLNNVIWLAILIGIIYFLIAITMAVIGSFANSLINIALYFYASKGQIPPAFSADMLNSIMIPGKKNGIFGRFGSKNKSESVV